MRDFDLGEPFDHSKRREGCVEQMQSTLSVQRSHVPSTDLTWADETNRETVIAIRRDVSQVVSLGSRLLRSHIAHGERGSPFMAQAINIPLSLFLAQLSN